MTGTCPEGNRSQVEKRGIITPTLSMFGPVEKWLWLNTGVYKLKAQQIRDTESAEHVENVSQVTPRDTAERR
ncbi:hypothetical protein KOW79_011607 [Hemibagrus wyckioides]|uniref:Uncharacterized protein n=1 Tax=Hemibagrus wyckioides TaxID=337641 RepID=A0A9D3NMH7_9TELE|nr:hypothetical protein KOW79_011607 [Hemibagrus wyckioides]